ncbi:MAG: nucleoside phosphorylase [Deltaproteobacteria bacterium]|nr:nucleoside phosphorylase [Deltaproteobacteria bacterium]
MNYDEAVINPVKGNNSPDPGSVVILVSSGKDMNAICTLLGAGPDDFSNLMTSRFCTIDQNGRRCSIVGPIIGAPYAVILLETLIAWGARRFVFFGLCGAISREVKTGDIVLPKGAVIEEGTSLHYGENTGKTVFCSKDTFSWIKEILSREQFPCHEGIVWTTDAAFRETTGKVSSYQEKNILAVEMETSALFTVGRFREVDVGAILVVSDELSTLKWKPGFGEERFKKNCKAVQRIITKLCLTIKPELNNA